MANKKRMRGKIRGQKVRNKRQKQPKKKQIKKEFVLITLFLLLTVAVIGMVIGGISKQTAQNEAGCEKFKDNVVWTSGYSALEKGSTNYQTWHLNHNCSGLAEESDNNCVIKNINIKAKFSAIGSESLNEPAEGYVQISEPDESVCDSPEKGSYQDYLAYETTNGEEIITDIYCGKDKSGRECGKITNNYDYSNCYGIKIYGSRHMFVDVLEVNYTLCMEE
jgi:hypothetical protein